MRHFVKILWLVMGLEVSIYKYAKCQVSNVYSFWGRTEKDKHRTEFDEYDFILWRKP